MNCTMFDRVKNVSVMLHYAGCSGSSHDRDHKRVTVVVVGVVFKLHPRQHKFVIFMYHTLTNQNILAVPGKIEKRGRRN